MANPLSIKLFVANEMAFESYRDIKRMVDKEKVIISAEIEKLQATDNEPVLNRMDVISNFQENWSLLDASQRRQFLLQFMGNITILTGKTEGGHFSTVKVLDATILPTEKQAEMVAPAFVKQR